MANPLKDWQIPILLNTPAYSFINIQNSDSRLIYAVTDSLVSVKFLLLF